MCRIRLSTLLFLFAVSRHAVIDSTDATHDAHDKHYTHYIHYTVHTSDSAIMQVEVNRSHPSHRRANKVFTRRLDDKATTWR